MAWNYHYAIQHYIDVIDKVNICPGPMELARDGRVAPLYGFVHARLPSSHYWIHLGHFSSNRTRSRKLEHNTRGVSIWCKNLFVVCADDHGDGSHPTVWWKHGPMWSSPCPKTYLDAFYVYLSVSYYLGTLVSSGNHGTGTDLGPCGAHQASEGNISSSMEIPFSL